ncbi:hypothetical protein GGU11DRAFT_382086 [Lentinula aff. detonsa]|nr:hypothetical protein GGU11DRAFT_382086 [Lentinula aff. detonsa]
MLIQNPETRSSDVENLLDAQEPIKFEQSGMVPASLQCCVLDAGDGKRSTVIWKEQLAQGGRRLYDLTIDDHFRNKEGAIIDFGVKIISRTRQGKDLWIGSFDYVYDDNWPWIVTVSLYGILIIKFWRQRAMRACDFTVDITLAQKSRIHERSRK